MKTIAQKGNTGRGSDGATNLDKSRQLKENRLHETHAEACCSGQFCVFFVAAGVVAVHEPFFSTRSKAEISLKRRPVAGSASKTNSEHNSGVARTLKHGVEGGDEEATRRLTLDYRSPLT